MMKTVARWYAEDHDKLDAMFRQYIALKPAGLTHARDQFRAFKEGLERHIAWEDTFLFPLFDAWTGVHDAGPTKVMRAEHQQIRELLNAMDASLAADEAPFERDEGRLLALIEIHQWKEETLLYPLIDQHLTAEERDRLFRRMAG